MERRKSGFSVFKESKVAIAGSVLIILVVLAAIFAPLLSPYDPRDQRILNRFSAPKADHLFGTDEFGRDILSRVIWGSRTSLTVGILSVLFAGFIGTALGIVAGFRGGITENVIMRFADAFLSLPSLLMGLIVIVALGGNDGLRGLAFSEIENSLASIIERCQQDKAKVLLSAVRMPPNYGPVYNEQFKALFSRLSDQYRIPLVPRMLDQVAGDRALMQEDGIHPNAAAQPQIMKNVWAGLEPMLERQ